MVPCVKDRNQDGFRTSGESRRRTFNAVLGQEGPAQTSWHSQWADHAGKPSSMILNFWSWLKCFFLFVLDPMSLVWLFVGEPVALLLVNGYK
jgi:hypothetical protein